MDPTPPPLPPRVKDITATWYRRPPARLPSGGTRDMHMTRPPERGREGECTNDGDPYLSDHTEYAQTIFSPPPPRTQRRHSHDRLPRSNTIDDPTGERDLDSPSPVQYDALPIRGTFKSHSIDVVEGNGDYMVGSAASIRQLLQQIRSIDNSSSGIDGDADNLDDMPECSPPPVPKHRKSLTDSSYEEIAPVQHSQLMLETRSSELIREVDYILMKPQTDCDVKREYERLSAGSDYAMPPGGTHVAYVNQQPIRDQEMYHLMHPLMHDRDDPGCFTRTKSAHLLDRPSYLNTPKMEARRGTVSTSTGDGASSLRRSRQDRRAGGQSEARKMRRSRSFDDILQDDGHLTMPQEAESLQDLLARASLSPSQPLQPDRGGYMVPPTARRPVPVPPTPGGHRFSHDPLPLPHSHSNPLPAAARSRSEAGYLDMSQASLERRKKERANQLHLVQLRTNQSAPAAMVQSRTVPTRVPVSSPVSASSDQPISHRYLLYDDDDEDEVDL